MNLATLAALAVAASMKHTTAEKEYPPMESIRIPFTGESAEGLGLGFTTLEEVKAPSRPSGGAKTAAAKAKDKARRKATHRMKARARAAGRA